MSTTVTVTERAGPMGLAARVSESLRSYVLGPLNSSDKALASLFGGGAKSVAGPIVNELTMFTCSAVYDAINQISSDVAKVPLNLHKKNDRGGSDHFTDSKTFKLLKYSPNPETRSMVFRRTLMLHALTSKGGYAEIVRDGADRPTALWHLASARVEPFYDTGQVGPDGRRNPLRYRVDGKTVFEAHDILNIHGIGSDGVRAFPMVEVAREAIGLALASQQFASAFFGNGTRFGGVLSSDQDLDPDQANEIREQVEKLHAKADKAFRLLVLGAGFSFTESGVKPNEAQMKEIRDQQVTEVARFFNMPLHKLKNLDRATNNNIEHQGLEYYTGCLLNWFTLWESELDAKLVPSLELGRQYFKHNVNAFLRGDTAARTAFYTALLDRGVISGNQVLSLEDLNPQPGSQGELLLVQGAMIPKDQLVELTAAKIEEAKAKAEPPEPAPSTTEADVAAADERARHAEALAADLRREQAAFTEQLTAMTTAQEEAVRDATAARDAAIAASSELAEARRERQELQVLITEAEALAVAAQTEAARLQALADAAAATSTVDGQARQKAEAQALQARQEADQAREELAFLKTEVTEAAAREAQAKADEALSTHAAAEADATRLAAETALRDAQVACEAAQARADALEQERVRLTQEVALITEHDTNTIADRERMTQEAAATLDAERLAATAREDALRSAQSAAEQLAQAEREALTKARDDAQAALAAVEARATAAAAKQAELEAALKDSTDALREAEQADAAGVAAVIAAHRGMVVDIWRRMVERETDRARRAQGTPEKLRAWMDRFYEGHEDLCRTALLPAVRVHLAFIRSTEDPIEATRRLVARHVDDSKRHILTVLDGDADDLAVSLPALLHRWETERVSTIADRLMEQELNYVRTR